MEPDRFDDVAFTVTEEPRELSPRSHLRRRVAAVLTAATITFGGLAAAADALTESGDAAKQSARPGVTTGADGVPTMREKRPCKAGEGHRRERYRDSSSALRY
jgi:hypothetical protein